MKQLGLGELSSRPGGYCRWGTVVCNDCPMDRMCCNVCYKARKRLWYDEGRAVRYVRGMIRRAVGAELHRRRRGVR
jgi:hypothetical protein